MVASNFFLSFRTRSRPGPRTCLNHVRGMGTGRYNMRGEYCTAPDGNLISLKKRPYFKLSSHIVEGIVDDEKKQEHLDLLEQLPLLVTDWTSKLPRPEFDIMYRNALKFVLMIEWNRICRATKTRILDTLKQFANTAYYSYRCEALKRVIEKPWSHPVFLKIIHEEEVSFCDLLQYFRFENSEVTTMRLEIMLEARCVDFAVRLSKACLTACNKVRQVKSFKRDELDYVRDLYFCALYKKKMKKELTAEIKLYKLDEGLNLLRRYQRHGGLGKGFNRRNEGLRIWKYSDKVIRLVANTLLANAMLNSDLIHSDTILHDLIFEWTLIFKAEEGRKFSLTALEIMRKLVIVASKSRCIYSFCSFLIENCGCDETIRNYVTNWLIRAINRNMNEIEDCRVSREYDKLKAAHELLAEGFIMLSKVFKDFENIHAECLLTSFSLAPSREGLQNLENFVDSFPNSSEPSREVVPAYYAQLENLVMDECEKEDLHTILRYDRTLSWALGWSQLKRSCEQHLEVFERRGFDNEVELNYLVLDYAQFKDKPIDDYIGIEKGYEQFLEGADPPGLPPPEMEDDSSYQSSSTFDDTDEDADYVLEKRKKRFRKTKTNICKKRSTSNYATTDWQNTAKFASGRSDTEMTVRRRKRKSIYNSDDEVYTKTLSSFSDGLDDTMRLSGSRTVKRSDSAFLDRSETSRDCRVLIPKLATHHIKLTHDNPLIMKICTPDWWKAWKAKKPKLEEIVKDGPNNESKSTTDTFGSAESSSPATFDSSSQRRYKSNADSPLHCDNTNRSFTMETDPSVSHATESQSNYDGQTPTVPKMRIKRRRHSHLKWRVVTHA